MSSDPITAAIGYCELGMWEAAWDELETLTPEERASPEVLRIRLGIYIALKRYESAAVLASSMIAHGDDEPSTWLHGAYAIRRTRTVEEARSFLLPAEKRLQDNATFHYTLACFECQLGNILGAKVRLHRAVDLNPALKMLALEDEDLSPVWSQDPGQSQPPPPL